MTTNGWLLISFYTVVLMLMILYEVAKAGGCIQ